MSGLLHTSVPGRFLSRARTTVKRLLLLHASAHQIALGIAVGIFFGILPTFGFGGFAVLAVAPFLRFNVAAALAGGVLFSNPLTTPFWVFLSCVVGGIDTAALRASGTVAEQAHHYGAVMARYLVGSAAVSLSVSLAAYYGVRCAHALYCRRRKRLCIGEADGGVEKSGDD